MGLLSSLGKMQDAVDDQRVLREREWISEDAYKNYKNKQNVKDRVRKQNVNNGDMYFV